MNRRQYLAGAGSVFAVGQVDASERLRPDDDGDDGSSDQTDETAEDDGGGDGPSPKTVLHLSSGDSHVQGMALRNAMNLQEDETIDNEEVRLVANMRGIFVFVEEETEHADAVRSLSESGVELNVCENTMAALEVSETDLLPDVDPVPSAVGELAERQAEGYGYIKVP